MRKLSGLIVVLLVIGYASWQSIKSTPKDTAVQQSKFVSDLADSSGVGTLLERSSRQKLDSVYIEADQNITEEGDRAFLTRRFDVEVITRDERFVDGLKAEIERRLQDSGLQVKQNHTYPSGFNIDYSSGSSVGAVDVRVVRGNGEMLKSNAGTYQIFLIFHESYLRR